MSTIDFHQSTTSTPEQFVAGLTDFGPGRSKVFAKSADSYLKVHRERPRQADVTEGSGGVWERLQYDWSDPNHVVAKTTDSNVFGGASGYKYTLTPQPDGTTDVRRRHRSRGQELQGPGAFRPAGNRRQGGPAQGICQQRQGDRGAQRRQRGGPLGHSEQRRRGDEFDQEVEPGSRRTPCDHRGRGAKAAERHPRQCDADVPGVDDPVLRRLRRRDRDAREHLARLRVELDHGRRCRGQEPDGAGVVRDPGSRRTGDREDRLLAGGLIDAAEVRAEGSGTPRRSRRPRRGRRAVIRP